MRLQGPRGGLVGPGTSATLLMSASVTFVFGVSTHLDAAYTPLVIAVAGLSIWAAYLLFRVSCMDPGGYTEGNR